MKRKIQILAGIALLLTGLALGAAENVTECRDGVCPMPTELTADAPAKTPATKADNAPECRDGVCPVPPELTSDAPAPAAAKNDGLSGFEFRRKHIGTASKAEFVAFLRGGKDAPAETKRDASAWWMLLVAVLGGILLNFTPCVLPMIPVNLMIIQASGKGAKRGFVNGGCYALGMTAAYGALGALAVLGGARFGELNSSPVFNFAIAGIFLVLALAGAGIVNIDFSRWREIGRASCRKEC